MRFADPAVHSPNERDDDQPRDRSVFIEELAVSARGLPTAASRAAANVATWQTYLPEDCVVAMIKDGWHRST